MSEDHDNFMYSDDEDNIGLDSDTRTLAKAFEDAMPSGPSALAGAFYFAKTLQMAPLPALEISDLGIIGLPLSKRDAFSIISCATPAPFSDVGGMGPADRNVANIWEISADRVKFKNPAFLEFLQSLVLKDVMEALGLEMVSRVPPAIELHKLLLYAVGSRVLPEQEEPKPRGMFATVLVVLPSAHTGGEVRVTYGSDTQVLDYSTTSIHSLSILSWFTNVTHEVGPLTSGYKLALSFNLVQPSSSSDPFPCPTAALKQSPELCRVFRRWKAGLYASSQVPAGNLLAYPLSKCYCFQTRMGGIKCLCEKDINDVQIVRAAAQAEGFTVLLAKLVLSKGGDILAEGELTVRKGEIGHTSISLNEFTDLEGRCVIGIAATACIAVNTGCLVPSDCFEGKIPDGVSIWRHFAATGGQLVYLRAPAWYRTAMIILPEAAMDQLLLNGAGVDYCIARLHEPTLEDDAIHLWITRIMRAQFKWMPEHMAFMYRLALQWRRADIWRSVLGSSHVSLETLQDLSEPWRLFGFLNMRPGLEMVIGRSTDVQERTDFIRRIPTYASREELRTVEAWVFTELEKVRGYVGSWPVAGSAIAIVVLREPPKATE